MIAPDGASSGVTRNKHYSELRLLQVDFAVRDERAPIGWVFGTFMYDCFHEDSRVSLWYLLLRIRKTLLIHYIQPWYRITPVGIMWGNDPKFTTDDYGNKELLPQETWINPIADERRKSLGGTRPSWGWNGRMNGPGKLYL